MQAAAFNAFFSNRLLSWMPDALVDRLNNFRKARVETRGRDIVDVYKPDGEPVRFRRVFFPDRVLL